MWGEFSAGSDRWSSFAVCIFWPQAVNGEVLWLTVCCDNKHRLSVTAQIDWIPNSPRILVLLIFLRTLYLPHLYLCIYWVILQNVNSLKLFSSNMCLHLSSYQIVQLCMYSSSFVFFYWLLWAFMPPLIIASICIMQLNSNIPLFSVGNLYWKYLF